MLILNDALGEPELDLFLSVLDRVRTVADVAASGKCKITTNSTGLRAKRVSRAEHHTARFDGVKALPNHGDDRARSHVLDQTREERPVLQVLVVLLEVLGRSVNELEGNELEATLLETADDVSDETAVDAVGLLHGTTDTILFNQNPTRGRIDDDGGAVAEKRNAP